MTTYIIKVILCSALFLLMYFFFLEKEKMHRFKRFYLLFSIAFSFVAPFITINKDAPLSVINETALAPANFLPTDVSVQDIVPAENHFAMQDFLVIIYLLITAFLLYRLVRRISSIYSKVRKSKSVFYNGSRLVLIKDKLTPHSFLNYIFLYEPDFQKGEIEQEILCHELTHVKQRHSIDILFVELIQSFCWFNPFIFLYKKAIKLNHEFLADEEVIKQFRDEHSYQYLLIDKASQQHALPVTSQFNFLITKKRLTMITKHTLPVIAFLKQSAAMIVLIAGILLFGNKEIVAQIAQDVPSSKTESPSKQKVSTHHAWIGNYAGGTEEGVPQELLTEYQDIIHLTKTDNMSWWDFSRKVPATNKQRLEIIFKMMSQAQQGQETLAFIMPLPPCRKSVPTQAQLNKFKNAKIYGVWLDGKKIANKELNNYNADDFSHYFISKLYGAAKEKVSYSYQVDMMTKGYYQSYYNNAIANKDVPLMLTQSTRPVKK